MPTHAKCASGIRASTGLAHWPIWIWVFFLAPGPLTFTLFAHGFGIGNLAWLLLVLVGTGHRRNPWKASWLGAASLHSALR